MKKADYLGTDLISVGNRVNQMLKENRYLNLRLKYNHTQDAQMKAWYKHQMDLLAKSIVNKKAIWL